MKAPIYLITSKQAANILHIAEQTLAMWRCKKIPHVPWIKIGRKVLYDKNHVLSYINDNTVTLPADRHHRYF